MRGSTARGSDSRGRSRPCCRARSSRRLHAEPEKAQPAFQQDHLGKGQRHGDDQARGDVRRDMADVEPPGLRAELAHRGDTALRAGADGERTGDAGAGAPSHAARRRAMNSTRRVAGRRRGRRAPGSGTACWPGNRRRRARTCSTQRRKCAREQAEAGAERGARAGGAEGDQETHADRPRSAATATSQAEFVGAERMRGVPPKPSGGASRWRRSSAA